MGLVRDLSGNGNGVVLESANNPIDISTADAPVLGKSKRLRATGAGDVVMRPAGNTSDMTITVLAGESIPVAPGTIIRRTGTTATGLSTSGF